MKTARLYKKSIKLPESWTELNRKQFIRLTKLRSTIQEDVSLIVIFLFHLLKIKKTQFQSLTSIQISALTKPLKFITKDIRLLQQHLPVIRIRFRKYYGTNSAFDNMSLEQFVLCERYYFEYAKTKNNINLYKLYASLYNRKGKEPNPDNYKKFKRLKNWKQIAIFWFYTGCRSFIMLKFKAIFKKSNNENKDDFAFINLINELNNNNVTLNEQIKKTNIYEAFVLLEKMKRDNDRIEESLKKKKRK